MKEKLWRISDKHVRIWMKTKFCALNSVLSVVHENLTHKFCNTALDELKLVRTNWKMNGFLKYFLFYCLSQLFIMRFSAKFYFLKLKFISEIIRTLFNLLAFPQVVYHYNCFSHSEWYNILKLIHEYHHRLDSSVTLIYQGISFWCLEMHCGIYDTKSKKILFLITDKIS